MNFEAIVVAVVLVAMLALVFLGVLSRYIFHFSFSFTEELVCAMFVLLSTMGGALASRENGHYTLDLITGMMKPGMKKIFFIIDTGLTCMAAAVLLYTGIVMVVSQYRIGFVSVALKIPNWVYGSFMPLGVAFILLRSIIAIIHAVRSDGREESR